MKIIRTIYPPTKIEIIRYGEDTYQRTARAVGDPEWTPVSYDGECDEKALEHHYIHRYLNEIISHKE